MKNILIHGLGQDNKSWDIVKEYFKENKKEVICPNLFDILKIIVLSMKIYIGILKNNWIITKDR